MLAESRREPAIRSRMVVGLAGAKARTQAEASVLRVTPMA